MRTARPTPSLMTVWRGRAGVLLAAFLTLEASILLYARTAGAHTKLNGVIWSGSTSSTGFLVFLCALEAFLAWRIWRGGSLSWYVLMYLVGVSALKTLTALVSSFGLYGVGLLVLLFIQLAVLISPAVRERRHSVRPRSPVS